MKQQAQSHVPTLQQGILSVIDGVLNHLHTCLPGIVERYDYKTQTAEIKPALKRKFADDTEVELPIIPGVPVIWPGTQDGGMSFPLNRGDTVALIFSERSMDEWISRGGVVSPADGRQFDLTDAMAIPRIVAGATAGHADNNDDMVLKFKSALIRIKSNGDIEIGGLNPASLQNVLTKTFKTLVYDNHIHPAPGGTTSPPEPIPDTLGLTITEKVKLQ
jgi:hypothetical protein